MTRMFRLRLTQPLADALHMFKDVQMAARLKVENATLRNEDGPGAN